LKNLVIKHNLIEVVFFTTSILLAFIVLFDDFLFEVFLKIICMLSLASLYYIHSFHINKAYFFILFFATISNVFFIFDEISYLTLGMFSYVIYRLITIVIVVKATQKLYFFSIIIGMILFLLPLIYFILLNQGSFEQSLIPAIVNVVLISVLGGLSISNYLMEPSEKNTWLLISTLLFGFLAVLFVIQKYYLFIPILDSLRSIVFMCAHYIFYRYMLLIKVKQ